MTKFANGYDEIVDYYTEVARGNVLDTGAVHKFGLAEDIDTGDGVVDIWDGAANNIGGKVNPYNWLDSPTALQISSTEADSTNMVVEGLDEDGLSKTSEVALTGGTPVDLPGLWTAVNRAYNSGSEDLIGYVFVSNSGDTVTNGRPDVDTHIRAIVHMEFQQTQMALYTVPSDSTLYITHGWAHISKQSTSEAIVQIFRRDQGGVFRTLHTLALQTSGSSGDQRPYTLPLRLKGGTQIVYRARVYSNSTAISAGFHGILIKE